MLKRNWNARHLLDLGGRTGASLTIFACSVGIGDQLGVANPAGLCAIYRLLVQDLGNVSLARNTGKRIVIAGAITIETPASQFPPCGVSSGWRMARRISRWVQKTAAVKISLVNPCRKSFSELMAGPYGRFGRGQPIFPASGVCNLVFSIPLHAAPPLPKQRRWAFYISGIPGHRPTEPVRVGPLRQRCEWPGVSILRG